MEVESAIEVEVKEKSLWMARLGHHSISIERLLVGWPSKIPLYRSKGNSQKLWIGPNSFKHAAR